MILRTYCCETCLYRMDVELHAEQWNDPPPECPRCASGYVVQEFKPPAIGGSNRAKATAMAETIAHEDYGVADIQADGKEGGKPKVRFKEERPGASTWGAQNAAVEQAVALGRENRLRYGSGLDALQSALRSGAQPDLIAASKRRSARIW